MEQKQQHGCKTLAPLIETVALGAAGNQTWNETQENAVHP